MTTFLTKYHGALVGNDPLLVSYQKSCVFLEALSLLLLLPLQEASTAIGSGIALLVEASHISA